ADITGKGLAPQATEADACTGLATDEILLDHHIAGRLQRAQVRPQIAISSLDDGAQCDELQPLTGLQGVERGHDFQPHRLMDDFVRRLHLVTPEPEPGQYQRAAAGHRHPGPEHRQQKQVAAQTERAENETYDGITGAQLYAAKNVKRRDEDGAIMALCSPLTGQNTTCTATTKATMVVISPR